MNRYDFTKPGGFPLDQGVLGFLQDCINTAAQTAMLCGPLAILSGCVVAGGSVSDGVIVINGEVLPFTGGLIEAKVVINEDATEVIYQDESTPTVKFMRTAGFGDDGGVTDYEWASFQRNTPDGVLARIAALEADKWRTSDVKEIDCTMAYIAANFDGTGLGTNERLGWAICNGSNGTKNRNGKVAVQLDTTQTEFNTMAKTGGEKLHELTESELPEITPEIPASQNGTGDGSKQKAAWSDNEAVDEGTIEGTAFGGGAAHNNLQPYIVTLFIQKL